MTTDFIGALLIIAAMQSPPSETFTRGHWTVERSFDAFEGQLLCRYRYHDPASPHRSVQWGNGVMIVSGFRPLVQAEFRVDDGPIRTVTALNYFGRERRFVESLNARGAVALNAQQVAGASKVVLRVNGEIAEINLVDFVTARDEAVEAGCKGVEAAN